MTIRKSVNIKYDISDESIIEGYFSTSSHSEIIRSVFMGVLGEGPRSHIAFGPYGAGKSFVSTIISGFLGKLYTDKNEVDAFIERFNEVDSRISYYFKTVSTHPIKYIPVVLNGFEGSFDIALIRNLNKQLMDRAGVMFENGDEEISIQVSIWQNEYPATYRYFESRLNELGLDVDQFLSTTSEGKVTLFKTIYKEITSGAEFYLGDGIDLVTTFERYLDKLNTMNLGVILVYDEFGRFLQSLDEATINKFMQQLQDLAELANNRCKNLSLLFITHKPISHYFSYLDKEKRNEFAKIEKRFTITSINTDNLAFINMARQVISNQRKEEIREIEFEHHFSKINKYLLFSQSLSKDEVSNLVIKGCYPLHPVTVYLLPILSRRFGQNERTLFTFLTDKGPFGLLKHLNASNSSYFPDSLVDYFLHDIDMSTDEVREINIFHQNLNEIEQHTNVELTNTSIRVYKFIFLWNILSSNTTITLSDHFIAYSLGLRDNDIEKVLDELVNQRFIRFNSTRKSWNLLGSNAINFNDEFLKRKQLIISHPEWVTRTLNIFNPHRILYPNDHNNKYEITRFALIRLALDGYPLYPIENESFDFLIDIGINTNPEKINSKQRFIGRIDFDIGEFKTLLMKLAILDVMYNDRQFALENRTAKSDLEYEKSELLIKLRVFYDMILNLNLNHENKTYRVKTVQEIEKLLDKASEQVYSQTIIVRNDQINMFQISKQQENPTIQIINRMMQKASNNLVGQFEGNKPDFLIYHSIRQANLNQLKQEVIKYLESNQSGSFVDLVRIAINPPYGVRTTLASLLIVYIIVDRWPNLMFFSEGNFIAEVPPETIYLAGFGKKSLNYVYSQFDFGNRDYLERVVDFFGEVSDGVKHKSLSIQALSSLNNWYLSLPIVIQLGHKLGIRELGFVRLIQKSKVNPSDSLDELVKSFSIEEITEIKTAIELRFDRIIDDIENSIKVENGIEDWKAWASTKDKIKLKSNSLVKVAAKSEKVLKEYARNIDDLEIERWPWAMFEMLRTQIKTDIEDALGKQRTLNVNFGGKDLQIRDIELTNKAKNLSKNLEMLVNANAKYITEDEIEKVVFVLAKKYIK